MPSSKNGSFKGLAARGGFIVNAEWEDGQVTSVEVESLRGSPLKLKIGGGRKLLRDNARGEGVETVEIETEPGSTYSFSSVK
jgi:alpha-L-fucosidase 2